MNNFAALQQFLHDKNRSLFESMYYKEFNNPSQVQENQRDQFMHAKSPPQLKSNKMGMQRTSLNPANKPSKYSITRNNSNFNQTQTQASTQSKNNRPQSAAIKRSSSQYINQNQSNYVNSPPRQQQQQYYQVQSQIQSPQQKKITKNLQYQQSAQKQRPQSSSRQQQMRQQQKKVASNKHNQYDNESLFSRENEDPNYNQNQQMYQTMGTMEMPQSTLVKTNLNEYFKCENDRCISCSECLKGKDQFVQYAYPKQMKSNYIQEFSQFDPNAKAKIFNLDSERLKVKKPYEVKRDFTSTNQAEYKPFKVEYKNSMRQVPFDSELNNPCFIGATTYNKTYQNWGANPVLKPAKASPHFINMKIKDNTTYKETYGQDRESMPKFMKEHEDLMKKACIQKMQKGSLARHVEVPFQGKSVSHDTFVNPHGKSQKELYKPFDQLFVPVQIPMKGDSEFQHEYSGKKVDLCKYLLNKSKPAFD